VCGRAEAAHASLRLGQLVDLDGLDPGKLEQDELRDAHPGLDDEGLTRVGVQERDAQLAAVAGVDEAGSVHDRDAVLDRKPGTRLDEARVALGDRDREAGADERALARRELDPVARGQVEAGVARVRARRDDRVVSQPPDRQLDQALSRCASATRKRA
jgi:hypothetical protein